MKRCYVFIFSAITVMLCGNAGAKSLLSAQSFPKTFNDLSFSDRMDVLAEGYEPYEAEYAAGPNGKLVCIKGCAYQGMSIEDHAAYVKRTTEKAIDIANQYLNNRQQQQFQYNQPTQQSGNVNIVGQIDAFLDQNNFVSCTMRNPDIPADQEIPYGEPVAGKPKISSPFGMRMHPIKRQYTQHEGIDYSVPSGTYVYTTANGTVDKVWQDKSCGNGLKIKYATGISALYCHLDHALVKQGDKVRAGCAVAISDNSGASTGAHLHYGMKDSNNDFLDPSPFTKRAK